LERASDCGGLPSQMAFVSVRMRPYPKIRVLKPAKGRRHDRV